MKKLFPILGIVCGIVCCILGIVLMDASAGVYADSASFGGDFYTYSVKATAAAANNVRHLAEAVIDGFSYLLLAIGLTDICLFGCKLTKASAPKAAPAMPAPYAPVAPTATFAPTAPFAPAEPAAPFAPAAPVAPVAPAENQPADTL